MLKELLSIKTLNLLHLKNRKILEKKKTPNAASNSSLYSWLFVISLLLKK